MTPRTRENLCTLMLALAAFVSFLALALFVVPQDTLGFVMVALAMLATGALTFFAAMNLMIDYIGERISAARMRRGKRLPHWLEPTAIRYWETADALGNRLSRVIVYGVLAALVWFTLSRFLSELRTNPIPVLLVVIIVLLWEIYRNVRNPNQAAEDDFREASTELMEAIGASERERERHARWIKRLGYCRTSNCAWCASEAKHSRTSNAHSR